MDRKENIIIVKSDPDFEWERRAPRRRKNGSGLLKKTVGGLLVAVLGFSGAVGGMFVYDEFIAEDAYAGGVVIQQQMPSPTPTGKPADPLAPDAPDQSADLPASALPQTGKATAAAVYETVSKSTVLFTCETVSQPTAGSLGDLFGEQFGGNFGVNPFQPQDPTQQDPSQQPSTAISYGSGVIMSADGYIMTNAHVVDGVTKINIRLFDGRVFEAKLVGSDPNTDVAVVKIDAQNLPAATFADSTGVVIGDDIYVVGNPLGAELAFSLTCGHISSVNREIAIEDTLMSLMQVDAAVNPGNSGGPMANSQGLIVGIVNAKIVEEEVEGIGFAIPANIALSIATELIQYGTVASRPMLGIMVESVQYEYAILYKDQAGITVTQVNPGSCAEKGGVMVGDKITHFNGVEVWCNAQLNFQKEKYKIGDTVTITVERNGETVELTVVLAGAN